MSVGQFDIFIYRIDHRIRCKNNIVETGDVCVPVELGLIDAFSISSMALGVGEKSAFRARCSVGATSPKRMLHN